MKRLYASKLEEGAAVAVVQDLLGVFARTKLLDSPSDETTRLRVLSWQSDTDQGHSTTSRSPVESVPACDVFGGWPALSLVLSHPVWRLEDEVAFMWPAPVTSVVVMCGGEALSPNVGLGCLLRSSEELSISINGVEYPLEHDRCASAAGKTAARDRNRKSLRWVIWSQAGGCCILLMFWAVLEWLHEAIDRWELWGRQVADQFTQSSQVGNLQHGPESMATSQKQFKDIAEEEREEGWSGIRISCHESLPGEIWSDTSSWHPDSNFSDYA